MDAIKAIYSRQSTKDFDGRQISNGDLDIILNCGMTAPVGMKRYDTLHLTIVQNKALLDRISELADMKTPERPFAPLYKAPTIVVVSSKFERQDHIEYANVGCVIENMAIAATTLGIGSVYLWGVIRTIKAHAEILDKLVLPQDFVPVSVLALGYPTQPLAEHNAPRHQIETSFIK